MIPIIDKRLKEIRRAFDRFFEEPLELFEESMLSEMSNTTIEQIELVGKIINNFLDIVESSDKLKSNDLRKAIKMFIDIFKSRQWHPDVRERVAFLLKIADKASFECDKIYDNTIKSEN